MTLDLTLSPTVYRFALEILARSWSRGAALSPTEKLLRVLCTTTYPSKETK